MSPTTPSVPKVELVAALARCLHADGYAQLQTVPYADHDPGFVREHLPSLLVEEQQLLDVSRSGGPVVYSRSLSRAHYERDLAPRLRLLGKLFLYNEPVRAAQVRAVAPQYLDFLDVDARGDASWGFRLVPVYGLLLLADLLDSAAEDRVFLHHDSIRMARRVHESLVLQGLRVADIGTGSGIIAAVAAQQGASHVIAADINPRALAFARINLDLNALSGVDLRLGSIEQVAGEADLLLSNPPYMQGRSGLCLDGMGADGLDIARRFVAAAAQAGKPLSMVLEVEHSRVATLASALQAPHASRQVLRRLADRELLWCDFPVPQQSAQPAVLPQLGESGKGQ